MSACGLWIFRELAACYHNFGGPLLLRVVLAPVTGLIRRKTLSIVSREAHLVSRPDGLPTNENFSVVERPMEIADNEVLVKNQMMTRNC